jgi:glutamate/tyrosine decarboxylase-like PLP-dependent enzyme
MKPVHDGAMTDHPDQALRSWFLGPRAENAALLERLVTEAIRDHVFWRRNFHPEDGTTIREADKRRPGFEHAVDTLTQELMELLAALKRDIPFFSGRYQGHMLYEPTLAAQVGYIAALLYNPNNIAAEAAPVTTALELEVAADLARMIGYDDRRAWGHLASGGTIANFEALWLARNIQYLPVALALAARDLGVSLEVATADGSPAAVESLPLWSLLNIPNAAALDLLDALQRSAPPDAVRRALDAHSLATVGYQEYGVRLAHWFGDTLQPAIVLVAATAHYSWEKVVRALGIGSNQLVPVAVDSRYRMDGDALWAALEQAAASRTPVLACVSVCGSTEESAVDRLDLVVELRERAARELGLAFHLHADACYGGYAAAMTRRDDGTRRPASEVRRRTGLDWPSDSLVASLEALGETDSVSVDPHKLGYIPYPAGAFLLRDRRARMLVAVDPPYLTRLHHGPIEDTEFLGRYILEGSKPGASAASVWLSHKVLPLDERGYGYLIERTAVGARRLHAALAGARLEGFRIVMLPEPDINIVCFLLAADAAGSLADVNALNEAIYQRMSAGHGTAAPDYFLTRTRLQPPMYDGAITPLLDRLGVGSVQEWKASGDEGLVVLRATVMDPFLADEAGADHVAGFVRAVGEAAGDGRAARESSGQDQSLDPSTP